MNPEIKQQKELDEQYRANIMEEARHIAHNFKRWGFRLDIFTLNPHKGWAKMTPKQVYAPEIYDLYLNDECIINGMYIADLRRVYYLAKRYKHDYGVKKIRENIKDIIK